MIDPRGEYDCIRAYYRILEADENGRPPDDPLFQKKDWSAFQIIAKRGDKVNFSKLWESFSISATHGKAWYFSIPFDSIELTKAAENIPDKKETHHYNFPI